MPLTVVFDVDAVPPRKPAEIPEGAFPLLVATLPVVMDDPEAVETVTSAPAAAITVASLTALIPELPEVITSPADVVTATLPGPRLYASIPLGAFLDAVLAAVGA